MLAPLRNRRFFSLAELNEAIATQVAWLNGRAFRGEVTSRRELFEELERKALRPLPTERFELAEWKRATVNIDYHVDFDGRYYSVPYQLVRQPVEVRATATTVEVLNWARRSSLEWQLVEVVIQEGRAPALVDQGAGPVALGAQVSGINRNECPLSTGTGVRIPSDSVSAFDRTTQLLAG